MFQVECIEDEERFFSLKEEWDELRANALSPSFFLDHAWFACCWPELRRRNEMRVFVVREERKAIAIAPLVKRRISLRGLPVEQLSFMLHPETQMVDILLRNSETNVDGLRVLLRYLLTERASDWQLISLDKINPDSRSLYLLRRLAEFLSLRYESQSLLPAPFIRLSGGWEAYLQSRSTRFRKTLRNVVNKIKRLGRVEVKRYGNEEDIPQGLQKLFSVSDASWKVANGIAITSNPERRVFFENLSCLSRGERGLQLWILEVDGIPIATETQIGDGRKVYALRSDFDERYADSSPGSYLQMEILKELFKGPYEEYSFGVGNNDYKMRWTDEKLFLSKFQLYNQTLYGNFLSSIRALNAASLRAESLRMVKRFFPWANS